MRRNWRFVLKVWALIPMLLVSSCGSGTGSDKSRAPQITVTVEPVATTVQAGAIVELTATLENDTLNTGVRWSISPDSGAGTLSDPSTTAVFYNAPVDSPESKLTATITATAISDDSKSGTAVITVSTVFIAIDPPGAMVEAGGRQPLTASVQHDPSQAGVTWGITPASGAGTLIDVTGTSATYEAPPGPPPKDLNVTITATSVADPALGVSAEMFIPAIAVQLTPDSALIPVNGTQGFVADVSYDPAARGVSWTLVQGRSACSPACGSLEDIEPTSVTFAAPATVPSDVHVTLMANSVTDPEKSSAAAIEIPTGTVKLVPAALDFGNVKENSKRTKGIMLTNAGGAVLTVSGISIVGDDASMFAVEHDCGTSVAAGASCQVDVTFSPTEATFRPYSAVLSIADSSSDSPQQIPLSGYGMPNVPYAVTGAMKYGSVLTTPAPTGAHRVGTTTVELIDRAREDPYRSGNARREVAVRFWYPAISDEHCRPAPYMDAAVRSHLSALLQRPLPIVRTNSCGDARLAAGGFPVVIFTHGYTGTFTDYTYLCEDLASRGYIVASVGHTYESTAVGFHDGRLATSVLGSYLTTSRMDLRTLAFAESVRLSDVRFLIDELARLNSQPGSPFAGHLDLASIGIAGHSFGGLTALESGGRDPRIRAVVAIDSVMPDRSFALTDTPVLILDAGRERWSVDEAELWRKLRGQRWALNLEGAEHIAPSDLIWLARSAIKSGRMTPEQTVAVIRGSVAAFLDASLRGMPVDPLLQRLSVGHGDIDAAGPGP